MRRFPKTKKRAGGLPLAFRKFNPTCESLERRELLASTITFNPTGSNATQPISVGSFDFAPGNSLSVGALPITVGQTIQLDYQAVLADVVDSNGNTVVPPGLNTSYQITAVASFTEVVTSATPTVATFALAPTQSANSFFELYYNPVVVANDLAGTGFNVGTLILAGKPDPSLTNSGNFALAVDATGNPVIQPFDLFNTNNYPGILSVTGAGSALVGASVTSLDSAFFITPAIQLAFNTSTTIPFATTDPSALFVGLPGGAAPNVTPSIGTINGVNGTDFQLQSDANNSFVAAAPAIAIAKQTNGQTALTPPGPIVTVGSTVTWTYDVTNPGNEPLKNVTVTDDNGTPSNPADDFHPNPVLAGSFNVGDTNQNGLLDPGEDWKYTFQGTAQAGQYANTVVTKARATSATCQSLPTASATTSPPRRRSPSPSRPTVRPPSTRQAPVSRSAAR